MICDKCKHKLPEDSEFCQYCGACIEKAVTSPVIETKEEPIAVALMPPDGCTSDKSVEQTMPAPKPQREKPIKTKYCSKCGSVIDGKTKKCTGCGKQYFRGLRFTKFSVTVIILALVIVALATMCVLQYLNTQETNSINQTTMMYLENKISDLEQQVKSKDAIIKSRDTTIERKDVTIKRLEGEIDDLEEDKQDNWEELSFFRKYAEIIPNDGTRTYHKWGCLKLYTSKGFWIFNTEAVADDYKECTYCH